MNPELLLDQLSDDARGLWQSAVIPSEWAQATLEAWGLAGSVRFERVARSLAEEVALHCFRWEF
jgi:hypothetical protein